MARLPEGYLDVVLQLRSYARVKEALDRAAQSPNASEALAHVMDRSPMAEQVMTIEQELRMEEAAKRR